MVHDLVHLGISPGEKAVRTAAVYAALLLLLHLAGKRQLAQLNSFDLVVLLLLSNVVQNAVIGNDNSLLGGLLGAVILIALNYVLVRAAFMSPRFGKALQGGSTTLFDAGELDRRAMRREAITQEELVAALRRQGLELDDVERVDLEPEGTFDATPKPKPSLDDVMRKLEAIEARLSG
ncbi:MAG TPA: YetF domain-containing protein [Gaiellaceae bacterium]|nr:YetF domain-containing protein [Gaiellaceae bacterium]